jgi:cytochrome b subunit of formate dehydrogenase
MTEFNRSAIEPSNDQPLHQHVGFEVLAEDDRIKVSRFSRRIRLLHWFNAIAIISLYTLGIQSIVSSIISLQVALSDLRLWHIILGISWIIGIPILWLISQIQVQRKRSSVISDQLIIKQRLFLFTSVGLMIFMALSGSVLTLLRPYDIPQLRSIILLLHGFIAFAYLPLLATHIYLAIIQRDSRQSLRTMISDVQIKYLIHNHIPKLRCGLSDHEGILFIKGDISEINLRGFHAKIELGNWQKCILLDQLVYVSFQHPELTEELILPISIYSDNVKDDCLHVNFNFSLPLQEVSRQLLSRGIFFRALFLARRHSPRLSCNYPITISHGKQTMIAQAIDIGLGGMGIIVPLRLSKGDSIKIHLELKNPAINWQAKGLIVVKSHIRNNDYSYGLCFKNLNKSESQQLSTILLNIKNQQSNKNIRYWTSV